VTTESSNTLADGMDARPDADALAIIRKGASAMVQSHRRRGCCCDTGYGTDTHISRKRWRRGWRRPAEKPKIRGKRVGLILSGGNVDFDLFNRWVRRAAAHRKESAGVSMPSIGKPDHIRGSCAT